MRFSISTVNLQPVTAKRTIWWTCEYTSLHSVSMCVQYRLSFNSLSIMPPTDNIETLFCMHASKPDDETQWTPSAPETLLLPLSQTWSSANDKEASVCRFATLSRADISIETTEWHTSAGELWVVSCECVWINRRAVVIKWCPVKHADFICWRPHRRLAPGSPQQHDHHHHNPLLPPPEHCQRHTGCCHTSGAHYLWIFTWLSFDLSLLLQLLQQQQSSKSWSTLTEHTLLAYLW